MVKQLSVRELSERLKTNQPGVILDVREPWETSVASLPGTLNIPMGEITQRSNELPDDQDIIVLCHHGIRSQQVAYYLNNLGFENLYNLSGGIAAWSRDVDPNTPVY